MCIDINRLLVYVCWCFGVVGVSRCDEFEGVKVMSMIVEVGMVYDVIVYCEVLFEVNFWVFEILVFGVVG